MDTAHEVDAIYHNSAGARQRWELYSLPSQEQAYAIPKNRIYSMAASAQRAQASRRFIQ